MSAFDTLDLGGITLPDNVVLDVFYGLRIDPTNSHFSIDAIPPGQGTIKLPTAELQSSNDYRQWFWSKNQLQFSIDANGHLIMSAV